MKDRDEWVWRSCEVGTGHSHSNERLKNSKEATKLKAGSSKIETDTS